MEVFQERMINEYKELSDRVNKLEKFINKNPLFDKLDKQERVYQVWQLAAMTSYRIALANRLIYQGIRITDDGIPDALSIPHKLKTCGLYGTEYKLV